MALPSFWLHYALGLCFSTFYTPLAAISISWLNHACSFSTHSFRLGCSHMGIGGSSS